MVPTRVVSGIVAAACAALALHFAAPLAAQEPAAGEPTAAPRLVVPEAAAAGPGFDVERATEAWLATIPAEARERSDAYFEGGYWLQLLGWAWTVAVALVLLGGGRARRLREAIGRRIRPRFLATAATVAALLAAATVLTLPLSLWTGYFREHAYGMSNQSLGGFLGDWAKELALEVLLGAPAIAAIYAVVRRAPRTWWLWGTGIAVAFLVFSVLISPVFIAPLFNRYEPLSPGPLRDEILSMARANRVPADEVYWFDASRQTKRVSANVSGFAGTLRVSLNDNLLERSPRETILAVLGHEIGHFVLDHVTEIVLSFSLLVLAGFAFVHFGFERFAARRRESWRLEGIGDPAGLPLAIALLTTFFLVASPVTNSIIRSNEAEADAFGLAAARQPDGFAFAAIQLSEYRKMKPGRLEEIFFYDHPSGYDRIHRAMEWKAENLAADAGR